MPDPSPRAQKQVRFARSSRRPNAISEQKHRAYEGSVQRVLVDGADGRGDYPLTARTKGGRLVHMRGDEALVGQFVDVRSPAATRGRSTARRRDMAELTPMKRQYYDIKQRHPTACCFPAGRFL